MNNEELIWKRDSMSDRVNILALLVRSVVKEPNKVNIKEIEEKDSITFEIKTSSADVGQVIGKRGRTIRSINNVMNMLCWKDKKKIHLKILR